MKLVLLVVVCVFMMVGYGQCKGLTDRHKRLMDINDDEARLNFFPKYVRDNLHVPINEFHQKMVEHPVYIKKYGAPKKTELKSNDVSLQAPGDCNSKSSCSACTAQTDGNGDGECLWLFGACVPITLSLTAYPYSECVWCDKNHPTQSAKCTMAVNECASPCEMTLFKELEGDTLGATPVRESTYETGIITYIPSTFVFNTVADVISSLGFKGTSAVIQQDATSDAPVLVTTVSYFKVLPGSSSINGALISVAHDSVVEYNTGTGTPGPADTIGGTSNIMNNCQLHSNVVTTAVTTAGVPPGKNWYTFVYECSLLSNRKVRVSMHVSDWIQVLASSKTISSTDMALDVELVIDPDNTVVYTGSGTHLYSGYKCGAIMANFGGSLVTATTPTVTVGATTFTYKATASTIDTAAQNFPTAQVSASVVPPSATANPCPLAGSGTGAYTWLDLAYYNRLVAEGFRPQCFWFRFDTENAKYVDWDPTLSIDKSLVDFSSATMLVPNLRMIIVGFVVVAMMLIL